MSRAVALTTLDNPWDPLNQYDSWSRFDHDHGYNSSELLDRTSYTSDQLSDEENTVELERAIDEIVKYDFLNIYKKNVYENGKLVN